MTTLLDIKFYTKVYVTNCLIFLNEKLSSTQVQKLKLLNPYFKLHFESKTLSKAKKITTSFSLR